MNEQERQALDALLQWLTETLIAQREPDRVRGYELLRAWYDAHQVNKTFHLSQESDS